MRRTTRIYTTSVRPNARLRIRVDADPSARNYAGFQQPPLGPSGDGVPPTS